MAYRRNKLNSDVVTGIGCIFPFVALVLTSIAGYVTHIFWVFDALMNDNGTTGGQFFLAIIGTLMPPIGCLHGFYLWFV